MNVLIWDEMSMTSVRIFSLVDDLIRRVTGSAYPFGGKQVILTGDFHQLPPVKNLFDECPQWLFQSKTFKYYFNHVVELQSQMRQEKDHCLAKLLDELRFGQCSY